MTDTELAQRLEKLERDKRRVKRLRAAALVLAVTALFSPALAQSPAVKPAPKAYQRNSGPLAFVASDVNPKTVFWIQGRFVPVDNLSYQGNAEVVTILCSIRESECLEVDSENTFPHAEEAWIQEFKVVNWDKGGILATSRSLDHCTDETLKIRYSPPSVGLINSPALPMSERCKNANHAWDKLVGKKGAALKGQVEQDMLVPTRGLLPFQDTNLISK